LAWRSGLVELPGRTGTNFLDLHQAELGSAFSMACNITRFYYCDPNIDLKSFIKLEQRSRNGVAFDDIETVEANAFEDRLIQEGELYLRVDL
jgi:hypothetical protein